MPELFRDPVWQFIGAVLALVAVLVAVILYLRQRGRKALSYEILTRSPLLSHEEEAQGKLRILFGEERVKDIYLVEVKITNSGNSPITADDYERPVILRFGQHSRILTAEVSSTKPSSLRPNPTIYTEEIWLDPILLNAGDSITLKMLVTQPSREMNVDGRIAGVKDIKEARVSKVFPYSLSLAGFILFVTSSRLLSGLAGNVMLAIALGLMLYGTILLAKYERRRRLKA